MLIGSIICLVMCNPYCCLTNTFLPCCNTILTCSLQIQDSGGVVKCCSLEGKIARLEVMGFKAMQSLKKMLHPIK